MALRTLRWLHITPVELADETVNYLATFLVGLFPGVETLSVATDKFNSEWRPEYTEQLTLVNAFVTARETEKQTSGTGL